MSDPISPPHTLARDAYDLHEAMRSLNEVINDYLTDCIDHCFATGLLPLPPLRLEGDTWGRTEVWYRGDLV